MPIQFISPTPEARPRKKVDPNSRCTVEQRRKIDLACQSLRLNQQVILHYARVRFELGVLKPLRGLQDLTYQQATRLLKEIKEGQVEC